MTVSPYASAVAALIERDVRLFLSYRMRPVSLFLAPLTTVTLFYFVSRLVRVDAVGSSDGYFAYVVVGIVAFELVTCALGTTPATLRQELVAGTFERVVVSPFGPVRGVAAMLAFPVLQGFAVAAVTLAVGGFVFGMPIAWPDVVLGLPAAVLAALAFAPFGILTVAAMLVVKQAVAAVSIIVTALSIFAGVYFPVALLPDWIEWVSNVQPFTPALDLLRQLISGAPGVDPALVDVAKLAAWAAVMLPSSLWVLGRAIRHSRLRGTIIEY